MSITAGAAFESLGIQKVRTVEAAANIALRGAHFKHDGTPIWLFQLATYTNGNAKFTSII